MPTNAIKKQLHLYFGVDGTILDKQGDLSANAQDDETFVINAYIEDGVVDNQTTLINFTPQDKMSYTSDWFAMFYRETVSYVVPTESEPRVFAKFSITVPSIILLVKSGKEQFTQRITIIQRYGNTHLGNFETITDLIAEYPPTVTLDENNDVAFVYSNEVGQSNQVGFYQVEYVSLNYVWVKKESILYNLSTKQFNFLGLTVNVGFSNPRGVPTVAQSTIYQLMQEISYQSVKIDGIEDYLEIAKPRLDQNDIENALIKQSNWNYESYLSEEKEFANSRNGWCQVENEIYMFGGGSWLGTNASPLFSWEFSNKLFKYNLTTREWTFLVDMPTFANESRCAYKNGFIYIYNGTQRQTLSSPPDTTNKFYRYEISTNTFTNLPNPPINILYISGLIELNDKIYIVVDSTYDGTNVVPMNSKIYIYDIVSGTWSEGSQTNTSFDRGYAVYYNGLIYVQRSLNFQAYNPTTNTWITNLTPPTYGVVHTGLIHVYKDRLFIGSGWQSSVAQNNPFIQYYDVKKDKWYVATRIELNYEPLGYGTLALFNNSLYYLGGYVNELNPVFNRYVMSFNLERLDLDNVVNLQEQVDDMKDGTDEFTEVAIGVEPNVARIRYIHTNGNNYQVLQVIYPDGREEEINETIPVNYRNESGVSLSSGRLLMTDGTSQGNQAVKGILFDPTSPNAYKILGVVTVDGVAVNQKSKATRFGIVHGIPTSEFASSGTAYAEGQYLWGVASGRLSNVAPTKPALRVQVGIIINLQGGNADVLVAPIIYQKISDASDTRIGITESGTMLVNGDILRYQTSTQTWANSNALVLVEIEINNIKNGTTIVKKAEQDASGNVITSTYETKSVVSSVNNRVTSLENANMIKSYTYNPSTHVLTFTYFDNSTTSFDLPLESAIIDASYDNATKDITFTLQNGSTLVVPLDDLVSGLASETWVTTYFIPKTSIVDNLTTDDATKVLSAKQGKALQDTKEALANKATDFTVVDDTKYPTTKAVDDSYATKTALALKADITQEAWITPTLLNGTTGNVKYMKDNFGFVHFKGIIITVIPALSNNVMSLPAGYRPINPDSLFPVVKDDFLSLATIAISSNGGVLCGYQGTVFLDGITFKAEA